MKITHVVCVNGQQYGRSVVGLDCGHVLLRLSSVELKFDKVDSEAVEVATHHASDIRFDPYDR
jgi:hypothetical protein